MKFEINALRVTACKEKKELILSIQRVFRLEYLHCGVPERCTKYVLNLPTLDLVFVFYCVFVQWSMLTFCWFFWRTEWIILCLWLERFHIICHEYWSVGLVNFIFMQNNDNPFSGIVGFRKCASYGNMEAALPLGAAQPTLLFHNKYEACCIGRLCQSQCIVRRKKARAHYVAVKYRSY